MMEHKPQNYILCATPRTGSTLLCSLLKSTGVAGVPESYFRQQDLGVWAQRWGLRTQPGDATFFESYIARAIAAGSTNNGVFAMRVMWGTMDEITAGLAALHPSIAGDDLALLNEAFGQPQFVYLTREDLVAQAVSRLKAEQTDIWHVTNQASAKAPLAANERAYCYDPDKIGHFVAEAQQHNAAWQAWFTTHGITPHHIVYEHLCSAPQPTIDNRHAVECAKHPVEREQATDNRQPQDGQCHQR